MSSDKENVRVEPRYKNTSDRYKIEDAEFQRATIYTRQFAALYKKRLEELEDRLLEQAAEVLGKKQTLTSLDKLYTGQKAFIGGIVHKKTKKRPSILDEFKQPNFRREEDVDESGEVKQPISIYDSICSSEDSIDLECGPQRVALGGIVNKDDFATGYVAGFYGAPDSDTTFIVEKIIFPKMAPQVPRPIPEESIYVLFLSGLELDSDLMYNEKTCLALTQLMDWIHGSSSDEDNEIARRVARVVIAGDSILIRSRNLYDLMLTKVGSKKIDFDPTAIEQLDRLLENFVTTVPVDLMSGATDICDSMMPQQSIVIRVFDKCYQHGTEMFQTVPNPYSFEIEDTKFLGTSGQNLQDLLKYTRGHSSLDCLKQLLERSYLVPTCPDTIDGYPSEGSDPFIIDEIPHVLFAGNQPNHEAKVCELANGARTLLMTIPKFARKHEAILLNVRTLETEVFRFEQML